MALSGATTPSQRGPGSNGNEGVLCIPQSPSITGTSQSDLVSYRDTHWGCVSYPSADVQSVYSPALSDWTIVFDRNTILLELNWNTI